MQSRTLERFQESRRLKTALKFIFGILVAASLAAGNAAAAGEDGLAISVTLFIMVLPIFLFWLPTKYHLSKSAFTHLLLQRGCWVLALWLMTLNASMLFALASALLPAIKSELTLFIYLYGMAGYLAMVFMTVKTIFDGLSLWKVQKEKERFGDEDE